MGCGLAGNNAAGDRKGSGDVALASKQLQSRESAFSRHNAEAKIFIRYNKKALYVAGGVNSGSKFLNRAVAKIPAEARRKSELVQRDILNDRCRSRGGEGASGAVCCRLSDRGAG